MFLASALNGIIHSSINPGPLDKFHTVNPARK
jgi:hypothetical protein